MNALIKALVKNYPGKEQFGSWSAFFDQLKSLVDYHQARQFLTFPLVTRDDKLDLITQVTSASPDQIAVVEILLDHDLLFSVGKIQALYVKEYTNSSPLLEGEISSDTPLAQERITAVEELFEKKLSKKVELKFNEDKDIVGIQARVGSTCYSLTLDDVIHKLNSELLRG